MKGIRSPLEQNGTANRLFSQTHSSVKSIESWSQNTSCIAYTGIIQLK